MFPDRNAEIAYYSTLQGYESLARTLLDSFRSRVTTWEAEARSAGVAEANVIAVLQSANLWDQATADLADIAIPTEIRRVQEGGAPLSSLSGFSPTAAPTLPDIATILAAQGGAQTGAARYTGGTVTVSQPPVTIAPAVAAAPSAATTAALSNVTPAVASGAVPAPATATAIDAPVPPNPIQETALSPNDASLSLSGTRPAVMGADTRPTDTTSAPSPTNAIPWLWAAVALVVVVAVLMMLSRRGG